jgi:hypothetical protein
MKYKVILVDATETPIERPKKRKSTLQIGVANKRKLAGWNKNYLIDLIMQSMG